MLTFGVLILIAILAGLRLYQKVMKPNVVTPDKKDFSLYIPTGAGIEQVKDSLYLNNLIADPASFEWMLRHKDYANHVKPGRYVLRHGMSNNQVTNMLRGGLQTPVKVTFNNIRDTKMLAGRIAQQIEADSSSIIQLLSNAEEVEKLGFNLQTIPAMFLPNTYEFYWNTSASKFVEKMKQEYDKFWNPEQIGRAS